jgi:hypothetical protein
MNCLQKIILLVFIFSFNFLNIDAKNSGRSGRSSGSGKSGSSSRSLTYSRSTYPRQYYYGYQLNPFPFYFIWFTSNNNPYISLDYDSNNFKNIQFCKLSNCTSSDQEYIISTSGNYSIDNIVSIINNITNVSILQTTLTTNFSCNLDVGDCVASNATLVKCRVLYLLIFVLGIIFGLNYF